MVIEFLTFIVPTSVQNQWKALDEAVWTRFLEKQEGFVRKELWQSPDNPEKYIVFGGEIRIHGKQYLMSR